MKLSNQQLSAVAAMGSFLPERLRGTILFSRTTSDETCCRERFDLWKTKVGGDGGERLFLKRLELEGINREKALEIMAEPAWDPGVPFPEWVRDLQGICRLFPFDYKELRSELFLEKEVAPGPKHDMTDALLPFVYYAERRLHRKLDAGGEFFAKSAFSDLNASLVKAIKGLCFPTFNYRFRLFMSAKDPFGSFIGIAIPRDEEEQYWQEFINEALSGGWPEILLAYPVLARLITITINQWVDNIAEVACSLAADARELETVFFGGETFGVVVKVETNLSDPHNNGKCVSILEFETGRKIVFKPRSMKIDQIWGRLLEWVNQKGIPASLLIPRVLDLGDHGWMEYIQNNHLPDQAAAQRFYFRAGVVTGLVYALSGTDFHRENLIAWGEHPALIDTETILQPRVKPFHSEAGSLTASRKAEEFLSDSILQTGFFPSWNLVVPGEPLTDSGSLTGKSDGCGNLPVLDGDCLNVVDYQEQLLEGFRWIYHCLIRHRSELLGPESPLMPFFGCKFRFIIRPSQTYGDMLRYTVKPEFLKDGLFYSMEIERLGAAYLLSAPDDILKDVWPIFLSESEALHRRDYPIFYGEADALGLMDATTLLYDRYFIKSAIDRAKELIGRLDQVDQRIQLDLIENSLETYNLEIHCETVAATADGLPGVETIGEISDARLIGEACRIYEQILAKRIIGQDGHATLIGQQYDLTTQKLWLGRIRVSLYDGVMGLALFMAALYRLTKEPAIKDNALKCIQPLQEALDHQADQFAIQRLPLGLGSGLAGLIISMMGLALYLDEAELVEQVRGLLHKFQPTRIEDDRQYDLLCGSAGLVLALTKFDSLIGDWKVLELVRSCGKHLLADRVKAKSGHRVWRSAMETEPLTGMGHGATGIACALLKVYELTGDQVYYEAAMEALDYETAFYYSENLKWPDLRPVPAKKTDPKVFMAGWCSGAPGIGLGRLANLELDRTPARLNDIENALAFTLQYPVNSNDHVCCGNSGRIDFLIEAALKLERPELLEEARRRMSWMINRKEIKGRYTFNADKGKVFNPSFFQGTAGVGYELLRCVAPWEIFSVLN